MQESGDGQKHFPDPKDLHIPPNSYVSFSYEQIFHGSGTNMCSQKLGLCLAPSLKGDEMERDGEVLILPKGCRPLGQSLQKSGRELDSTHLNWYYHSSLICLGSNARGILRVKLGGPTVQTCQNNFRSRKCLRIFFPQAIMASKLLNRSWGTSASAIKLKRSGQVKGFPLSMRKNFQYFWSTGTLDLEF